MLFSMLSRFQMEEDDFPRPALDFFFSDDEASRLPLPLSLETRSFYFSTGPPMLRGSAATQPPPAKVCARDLQQFCAAELAGLESVSGPDSDLATSFAQQMCLMRHEESLSSACHQAMTSVDENLVTQCYKDIDLQCAGVLPGGSRVHACLKAHKAELTAGCAAQLRGRAKRVTVDQRSEGGQMAVATDDLGARLSGMMNELLGEEPSPPCAMMMEVPEGGGGQAEPPSDLLVVDSVESMTNSAGGGEKAASSGLLAALKSSLGLMGMSSSRLSQAHSAAAEKPADEAAKPPPPIAVDPWIPAEPESPPQVQRAASLVDQVDAEVDAAAEAATEAAEAAAEAAAQAAAEEALEQGKATVKANVSPTAWKALHSAFRSAGSVAAGVVLAACLVAACAVCVRCCGKRRARNASADWHRKFGAALI